jgi:PadR family transcriptional regulator PadR
MDAQLKKGILEICVLAELCRGASYGYKIEKDLEGYVQLSESALYHILKRHEQAGYVRAESVEHGGRLRRVYAITEAGRGRLEEFKQEWREAAKAFSFIERAAGGYDQV